MTQLLERMGAPQLGVSHPSLNPKMYSVKQSFLKSPPRHALIIIDQIYSQHKKKLLDPLINNKYDHRLNIF